MLDYGPHTANEHTDAVTAKHYHQMLYLQSARPNLTNPYLVTETAEKILLDIVHVEKHEPLLTETQEEWITRTAKTAMDLAKALHAEFKRYEDQITQEEMTKAIEDVQKNEKHHRYMATLLNPNGPAVVGLTDTPKADFT